MSLVSLSPRVSVNVAHITLHIDHICSQIGCNCPLVSKSWLVQFETLFLMRSELGVEQQYTRSTMVIQCKAPTSCLMISAVIPVYFSTTVHLSTATLPPAASRHCCCSSSATAMTWRYLGVWHFGSRAGGFSLHTEGWSLSWYVMTTGLQPSGPNVACKNSATSSDRCGYARGAYGDLFSSFYNIKK